MQLSHPSLFANDTAGFFTSAMSAGVGAAALLVVAVSPAGAAPFDLWPSARTQAQSRYDDSNQRFAYRSRESRGSRESKEKVAVKQVADDLAAKAKAPMQRHHLAR